MESVVGREKFDAFIRAYFDSHAFQSITTDDFVKYFNENLIKGDKVLAEKIKMEDWVFKADVPANITPAISPDFNRIDSIQKTWRQTGIKGLSQKIKSTNEKQHFIDHLPNDITPEEMAALDREFEFTEKGNFVIKSAMVCPFYQAPIPIGVSGY